MIECALLTGGRSVRMGRDKALLPVGGEPQAVRIVRLLAAVGVQTAALGRKPVEGATLLLDDETVRSPMDALRRFRPSAPFVLVLSCDLPRFDAGLVQILMSHIGDADAAIPFIDEFRQPLVGLYRAEAFDRLPNATCPMDWLDLLKVNLVIAEDLQKSGVHPNATRGANTPDELRALMEDRS